MNGMLGRIRTLLRQEFGERPMTCTLATTTEHGRATARTMVVRDVSDGGVLLFVSDRRTRKDDDLRDRRLCEVCFWLPTLQKQIRVQGEGVVFDGLNDGAGLREAWWERLDEVGVLIFSGKRGTPETVPMPVTFELITVTPTWVGVDDYGHVPPTHESWGVRD